MTVDGNRGAERSVRRTIDIDLNGDGFADRITMGCRGDGPPSDAMCSAEQVEMGVSDGSFISVFSKDGKSPRFDSDSIYYSPQFFLHAALAPRLSVLEKTALPGKSAGTLFLFSDKPVEKHELIGMCSVNYSIESEECAQRHQHEPDVRQCIDSALFMAEKCIEYAGSDPSNHMFQSLRHDPAANPMNDGAVMVELDQEGLEDRMRWFQSDHLSGGSELALPFHEIYSPFSVNDADPDEQRLKLRANVIMDVKAGRSEDVAEYIYAYSLGEISETELKSAFYGLWFSIDLSRLGIEIEKIIRGSGLLEELDMDGLPAGLLALPDEHIYKLAAKKAEERAESDAYQRIVSAAVKRIRMRPDSLDEAPELLKIVTELINRNAPLLLRLTRNGDEHDMLIDDCPPKKMDDDEIRWIPRPQTGKTKDVGISGAIKRNPEILKSIPGLGMVMAAYFKSNPMVDDFPESRAALDQARSKIPEDGFLAETTQRFSGAIEHLKRLASTDTIPLIEEWAEADDVFTARIVKSAFFDTERHPDMLYDPQVLTRMLAHTNTSPAMTITRNNPRAEANLLRQRGIRSRILARRYARIAPTLFVDWVIDLQTGLANKRSLNSKVMDEASYMSIFQTFDNLLDDPAHTSEIITHMVSKALSANGRTPASVNLRFDVYIPMITRLVQNAVAPSQIPDVAVLIENLDRYPAAHPALLIACSKKGDRSEGVIAWVKRRLDEEHRSTAFKIASAFSSILLDEEDKLRYLEKLAKHENPEVRIAALSAMMREIGPESSGRSEIEIEGPPAPIRPAPFHREITTPSVELIRSVGSFFGDTDLRVKYLTVHALMKWNTPDVAGMLAADLVRYHEITKTMNRRSRRRASNATPDNCKNPDLLHVAMMERPIVAGNESPAEDSPTLKLLALQAITTFGQPRNTYPVLEEMIETEKDAAAILFTAQALLALKPQEGLHKIFDRLEAEKAPQNLIIIAASAVSLLSERGIDAASYVPRLAHYLHTNDDEVHSVVASALSSTQDDRILPWIIARSSDTDPLVRKRMAEALPYFDSPESAMRSIELTDDSDENVRLAALAALDKYRTHEARKLIESRS